MSRVFFRNAKAEFWVESVLKVDLDTGPPPAAVAEDKRWKYFDYCAVLQDSYFSQELQGRHRHMLTQF